jgi:hypothetical protein
VGNDSHSVFGKKILCEKRECENVRYRDARASCFVAKVRDEVFAHFSRVLCKASQQYAELTVSPAKTNAL